MFDLIAIGDSTVDVFLELHEAQVNCEIDPHECKLVLNYADKIPVDKLTRVAAVGNAANNAVGSARLGLAVGLYTLIGDDSDGREMRSIFKSENVRDDYVITDTGKRSNFSTVINFKGERTILVYHEERDYQVPRMEPSQWVYLTSVGKGHDQLHQQVLDYVHRAGAKLVFQPGSHQLRDGLEKLKPVMSATYAFIVNKEEAQKLLGKEDEVKQLLPRIYELGPKMVVITDGTNGSWSYDGQVVRFAALIKGLDVEMAMRWGSANGSSVVEHVGAREGLLNIDKIEERIKSCPECKVVQNG